MKCFSSKEKVKELVLKDEVVKIDCILILEMAIYLYEVFLTLLKSPRMHHFVFGVKVS